MSFGKKVRAARRKRKWTQVELAKATGLSWEHISRIEGEKHRPFKGTVLALCASLGLPIPKGYE